MELDDVGAVLAAIADFKRRGRDDFLAEYGFGRAHRYFLVLDGEYYDSKAIAGVAHLYQHGTLLASEEFAGGESTVAARLRQLGFVVQGDPPDWAVDELLLALDLYLRTWADTSFRASLPSIMELSTELRSLRVFPDEVRRAPNFRSPNSVALKLHNFAAIDSDNPGSGMPHVGVQDREVWKEWAPRPNELQQAVQLIRAGGASDSTPPDTQEEEEYQAPEGRILFRQHRRRERDPKLVRQKKGQVWRRTGRLACEVCDFDSAESYGLDGVIDIHHVVPLHVAGESVTRLGDLAVVCPTCHRVLHRHRPIITPAQLRAKREGRRLE